MAAVPATFGALLVVFLAAQSAVGYREDPEVHMDAVRTNFSADCATVWVCNRPSEVVFTAQA